MAKIYAPRAFRLNAVDYPYGHQDVADDTTARAIVAAGLAQFTSNGPEPGAVPGALGNLQMDAAGLVAAPDNSRQAIFLTGLVANDQTAAGANLAKINAALIAGGTVWVLTPGNVFINGPIVVQNGINLRVGKSTTIKLADNTNTTMLRPAAFQPSGSLQVSVTLTWTAGCECQVGWPGHGLTREDYVWIQNVTQTEFDNIFRVTNVIDANNFMVILRRTPTAAPTGTPVAQVCTRDFTIEGGYWDYNAANNQAGTGYNKDNWALMAAANFRVKDVHHIYWHRAVTTGACADYEFDGAFYRTDQTSAAEAHKTYGPINRGRLKNIVARSTDDCMSLQPKEATAFSWTGIPFGDVFDLTFEDITLESYGNAAGGALVIYASDNETADNITYRNCRSYSQQGSGFICKFGNGYSLGKLGQIFFENCRPTISATAAAAGQYPMSFVCPIDKLVVRGEMPMAPDTAHSCIRVQAGCVIKSFEWDFRFTNSAYPAAAANFCSISGTVNALLIRGIQVAANQANCTLFGVDGTVQNMTVDGGDVNGVSRFLLITGTVQNLLIRGANLSNMSSVVEPRTTATPANITLQNCNFSSIATAVIRPSTGTGTTCKLFGGGGCSYTSAPLVAAAGSATFEVHSFDLQVNVGATGAIKTVAGQYAFNTTVNGTLVANRAVTCNGTNWVQVDTPANIF